MKILILLAGLLVQSIAVAQTVQQRPAQQQNVALDYNYLELRFVDVDTNGGDGLRFNGSYDFGNSWLLVGGITSLDFNSNVDATIYEVGAGYIWHYSEDFDLVSTARFASAEIDNPSQSFDDNGVMLSAGVRGLLTREFEIRGSVNHTTVFDSDTYLELAGDYHFSRQFAAGLSLEFAGDDDVITFGGRWFFR